MKNNKLPQPFETVERYVPTFDDSAGHLHLQCPCCKRNYLSPMGAPYEHRTPSGKHVLITNAECGGDCDMQANVIVYGGINMVVEIVRWPE